MGKKRVVGGCQIEVPENVLKSMQEAGADYRPAQYQGKAYICCNNATDMATQLYCEWIKDIHEDPDVQAVFFPTGGVIPPVPATVVGLQQEANWIIHHCAGLGMNDFAGGAAPVLGPPVAGMNPPVVPVPVHHASVAGNFMIGQLQHPPTTYPTINSQGTGTFICTIQYMWSNVVVAIQVFKG